MKQVSFSSNPFVMSKRNQNVKVTICLFMVFWSLFCRPSLADPETVDGLVADNINLKTAPQQALKTQKKQYSIGQTTFHQTNNVRNKTQKTKLHKLRKFQAQKHQKLLNAIQENESPRIYNKQSIENPQQSAIRNILAAKNNRIQNKITSDVADRNINFLNERARPPQHRGRTASGVSTLNQDGLTQQTGNDVKHYPSLHPDTIQRISQRGQNGQPPIAFGKFLQNKPNYQYGEQNWKNYGLMHPQKSSYQILTPVNQPPPLQFLQRQFNLPKIAYKENQGDKKSVVQNWNGKSKLNNAPRNVNVQTQKHRWPIQSSINRGENNQLDSRQTMNQRILEKNSPIIPIKQTNDDKPINKNKDSDNIVPGPRGNSKKSTGSSTKEIRRPLLPIEEGKVNANQKNGQNLNQQSKNMNMERNTIEYYPHSSPSSISVPQVSPSINSGTKQEKDAPKMEMLKATKKASFDSGYDSEDMSGQTLSALAIGLTFVAIFIVMAFGLVAHTVYNKLNVNGDERKKYFSGRGGFMRTPTEEDRTPPELRSGCGQAAFVQPELSNSINSGYACIGSGIPNGGSREKNGSNQPFFNGKLILHEVNSTSVQPGFAMNGLTSQIPPISNQSTSKYLGMVKPGQHLGAIPKKMPSPAANVQVTDDLISPKYDNDDEHRDDTSESEEEEDSSDDTVYECPGLAASSGEEIVVANPFFMPGQEFTPLVGRQNAPSSKAPKPISRNETIFHQGIAGFN